MRALSTLLTRRRVAGSWALLALIGAGLLIGLVGAAERDARSTDSLPYGSENRQATELAERLPDSGESTAVVLFTRDDDGRLSQDDLATAQERVAALEGAAPAPLQPSEDGTAAVGIVSVDAADATGIADRVGEIRDDVRADLPDGLRAEVTGPAAVQADLAAVFDGANVRLLLTTAGVVAVLLVLTYRSPVLWIVPLTVVGVADQLAAVAATHLMKAFDVVWDESTVGILSVLVFGAGTDYALLLISRYRDELRLTEDRRAAMAHAVTRTTEAIVASAATVFIGLLTLLLSLFPATRGLGLACAVGVLVAAAFVLLVLPSALVVFGRWVFWPRVPHVGEVVLVESRSWWRRIGDAVAARPWAFVVTTVLLLGLAGGVLTQVRTGLAGADLFLQKPEAISAGERLAESFPAGSSDPVRIVSEAPVREVVAAVEGADGVQSVRPGATGDGTSEVLATLEAAPGTSAAQDGVAAVRDAVADLPSTYVGGTDAKSLDEATAQARDRLVVLPVILGLVLLALVLLLRSLVAPVVLVATVVLTYLSSLGLSWLLFTQVLGFERLDGGVPLLAFVFLVALGVDYNIFLVTRAREEGAVHGVREGMLRALAATGGVITSAGILLAAVFAVLGVLPLVTLAQLGVIICIGVLLDTLVVRTLLVPALALVLGERFWWPRRVDARPPEDRPADRPGRHAEVPA